MKEKLISLLLALGIPQAEAQKFAEDSANDQAQVDIKPIVDLAIASQRKILENDPDLADKYTSAERGKQLDIITRDLKRTFGLTSEEIKDKSVKEIIEFAKTKASNTGDKTTETLQKEIIDLTNKLKDYEENVIPQTKAEVDSFKKKITIDNELSKVINSKKLRVPFDAAYPSIISYLSENFDLDVNDKKELALFVKGTKLHPTKEDKSGLIGINDILENKLREWKFIEESNADKTGGNGSGQGMKAGDTVIIENKEKAAVHYPGLEKAKENLEAAKNATKTA